MSVLRIADRPDLRRPILLAGFGGWGDAGAAATGALSYLLGDPPPSPCAVLDPEACFDFTVQRPVTRRDASGRWKLEYPEITLHALVRPDAECDLLVLRGPEPHASWPTIARAVAEYALSLGVERAVTFGAFIGPVSHRRIPIVRRTPNADLDARLAALGFEDTAYAGPTAFVTALLHGLDEAGIPAASLWAASPGYLGAPNPAVSLSLLEAAERALDADLELGRLQGIATDFLRKVESAIRANPEVAERLNQLLEADPADDSPPDADPPTPTSEADESASDLPSGRDLVEELERFLRGERGSESSDPEGGTG
ncbi:MAG: PAC2 family protein [Chloroflexi bacterium]|nr:PAC2 family protein [Chloroflexota bacterium]